MIKTGKILKGLYFDSVTLMRISAEISKMRGVIDSSIVMGTKENKSILDASGLLIPLFDQSNDSDLLIAINVEQESFIDGTLEKIDELIKKTQKKSVSNSSSDPNPRSLETALEQLPNANIALISVAGKYAGNEAMKALEKGLHVMLFSDNVSIETELSLKQFAQSKGLLVMGPDCGTAIINGIPLAFANVVERGNIGIVAASGTGLQELTTIISNEGAGISQAIGVGGRDIKKEIGGIMFIEGLKSLLNDENTTVIILASKPPHKSVIEKIAQELKNTTKKVIAVFLGADTKEIGSFGIEAYSTFEETALRAVSLSKKENSEIVTNRINEEDKLINDIAKKEAAKKIHNQKYLRGLFSGGTFCGEAQVIFKNNIKNVYSNAPIGDSIKLENSLKSQFNTVIDLGEDEFTVGRPHPMIDFSLRKKRIIEEAKNPEVAVILLDVVLGYGSCMTPAEELAEAIKSTSKQISVVCSITGTNNDPQNRTNVQEILEKAGAIVMPTNTSACKLACKIIELI